MGWKVKREVLGAAAVEEARRVLDAAARRLLAEQLERERRRAGR